MKKILPIAMLFLIVSIANSQNVTGFGYSTYTSLTAGKLNYVPFVLSYPSDTWVSSGGTKDTVSYTPAINPTALVGYVKPANMLEIGAGNTGYPAVAVYTFNSSLPAGTVLFMQDIDYNEVFIIQFFDGSGAVLNPSGGFGTLARSNPPKINAASSATEITLASIVSTNDPESLNSFVIHSSAVRSIRITQTGGNGTGSVGTAEFYFAGLPLFTPVSGNVFNDVNINTIFGSTGSTGSGEIGTVAGASLFAYLIIDNVIVDKAVVNANGSYTFANAPQNAGAASVVIGVNSVGIGSASSTITNIATTPPAGWQYIGSSVGGTSNGASGTININLLATPITNLNFGITSSIPFACSKYGYQTKGTAANDIGLYQVDLVNNTETLINANIDSVLNIGNTGIAPLGYIGTNGIAYNPVDNYIYGGTLTDQAILNPGANLLRRIDATGTATTIPLASGTFPTDVYAADINSAGFMYMMAFPLNSKLYVLDLNTLTMGTAITLTNDSANSTLLALGTSGISDFAFNPIDGHLYGIISNTGTLLRINVTTGVVTALAYTGTPLPFPSNYGAIYFDFNGTMYADRNVDGTLYKITNPAAISPILPVVSIQQTGIADAFNDGARCVANTTILPLKLKSFTANTSTNCSANLKWTVADVINFNHYEVEQSVDAIHFFGIKTIASLQNKDNYFINVELPESSNRVYYRLKMVDNDAQYQYSNIVSLAGCKTKTQMILAPNPAQNSIQILGIEDGQNVRIFDALGRQVMNKEGVNYQETIQIDFLPGGIYTVQILDKDQRTSTSLKLVKN